MARLHCYSSKGFAPGCSTGDCYVDWLRVSRKIMEIRDSTKGNDEKKAPKGAYLFSSQLKWVTEPYFQLRSNSLSRCESLNCSLAFRLK